MLPVVAAIVAILGYPLYRLTTLSFQRYGLPELIQRHGEWIGLDNYRSVLSDSVFWDTLVRTIVFTAVNVASHDGARHLGRPAAGPAHGGDPHPRAHRARPRLVDAGGRRRPGLVLDDELPERGREPHPHAAPPGDFEQHDWYATTFWKLAMVTLLIVWGALPFVIVTMYAGLSQVPRELVEAARIDGASPWRVFRDITFPTVKPIVYILTSLSIIWDFGVFTQPYLLIGASHVDSSNYLMGVYVFIEGYAHSDFGRGAAISILMLVMVAAMSVVYVRRMVRMGEVRERGRNDGPARRGGGAGGDGQTEGLGPPRPRDLRRDGVPRVLDDLDGSQAGRRDQQRDADVVLVLADARPLPRRDGPALLLGHGANSLIIVSIAVLASIVIAFLAAVALAKYRFGGRKLIIVLMIGILMLPQAGLVIPLYVVLAKYHLVGTMTGVILTYLTFVLPFAVWTLRGFILGIPKDLEEAAMVDGSSRLGAFVRILLPLAAPGLVATAVFAFVTSWNEYIFASVLLSDQSDQTVTVWLAGFYGGSRNTDWGGLMAASTLTAIPVIVFFLLVQRRIMFGLTAGAVRG